MRKFLTVILIILLLSPASVFSVGFGEADSWPMIGGDTLHSSRKIDSTLTPNIQGKPPVWRFDSIDVADHESVVWSSPLTDGEHIYISYGKKYLGSSSYTDSGILKIDLDNDQVYKKVAGRQYDVSSYDPSTQIIPTPALIIEDSGTSVVYVDSSGNIIVDENRKNQIEVGRKPILSSPIVHENKIYVGTSDGYAVSIDIDDNWETHKFSYEGMGKIVGSVGIVDDLLVFADDNGYVYIFDIITGELLSAEKPIPDKKITFYTPTIVNSEKAKFAVFAGSEGYITRVSLDEKSYGKSISRKVSDNSFVATPLALGTSIYIGDEEGNLYKIKIINLEEEISRKLDYQIKSQIIYCNKFVYQTTQDRNSKNGSLWVFVPIDLSEFKILRRLPQGRLDVDGSSSTPLIVGDYMFIPSSAGNIIRYEGNKAKLKVSTNTLDFGSVAINTEKTETFVVENDGGGTGTLSGEITVEKDWLECTPSSFELDRGESIEIEVLLQNTDEIPVGILHQEEITITSNAGTEIVTAEFEVTKEQGEFDISTESIDFGQVIKGDSVNETFSVFLEDHTLDASVICETEDDWLTLSRSYFELSGSSKMTSIINIDTSNLSIGTHTSKIDFFHAKNPETKEIGEPTKTLVIKIEVVKRPAKPITDKNSETIYITDCFLPTEYTTSFVIRNDTKDGEREALESNLEIKLEPDYEWLSADSTYEKDSDMVIIECRIRSEFADFWPNENFSSTLSLTVSGTEFSFDVSIVSSPIETCSVSFVIDSEKYTVNSRILDVTPAPFISENGNTMVPIRFIAEPLEKFYGAEIEWIPDLKTVLFTLGDTTLRLRIGNTNAYIERGDGSVDSIEMNSAAEIVDGRTFIPPRTIAEAFGAEVKWNGEERKADFIFTSP